MFFIIYVSVVFIVAIIFSCYYFRFVSETEKSIKDIDKIIDSIDGLDEETIRKINEDLDDAGIF